MADSNEHLTPRRDGRVTLVRTPPKHVVLDSKTIEKPRQKTDKIEQVRCAIAQTSGCAGHFVYLSLLNVCLIAQRQKIALKASKSTDNCGWLCKA